MADPKGFMKTRRQTSGYRSVNDRIKDYKQVSIWRTEDQSRQQASRCMDCGTPFCHWGCPMGNYIPEWNDLMSNGHWQRAFELLQAANNFPEFTGRVCPATCEYACVLGINDDAITICENELAIIEYAFKKGLVRPVQPVERIDKKIAVVGSGPAGLACAMQLNRAGYSVTVYEKDDKVGGILRYGIPDFKLEKWVIERRVNLLEKEGVEFETGVDVGVGMSARELLAGYDAICLAGGSRVPCDLRIEGRDLEGIHFAMDYLTQSNRRVAGEKILKDQSVNANGKKVVVIGGGDTGSDCVGSANRQGASHIVQIEILPKPLECRTEDCPWPAYPMILKSTSSHEEGVERHWSILTKRFAGGDGRVRKLECVKVEFTRPEEGKTSVMKEVPGSEFEIKADLVILAVGFVHPEQKGLLKDLGVGFDEYGNVRTDEKLMTTVKKVFTAGDMHSGQSLVVRAISEGRCAAHSIDKYLMGSTNLPDM